MGMGTCGQRFAEVEHVEGAYYIAKMAKGGNIGDRSQEDKGKDVVMEALSFLPCAFTRDEMEAWEVHKRFLENCLEEAQSEVDQVEDMVKIKCKQTFDEDI
jgi:hypothetical protein